MPRFFFDIRSGDTFVPDTTGVELAGIEAAVEEATMALAWGGTRALRS